MQDSLISLLESCDISKRELAKRLGISPQAVSNWATPPRYAIAYLELLAHIVSGYESYGKK